MRALVTGASGFIGSHIAERLAATGDSVRAFVRPASGVSYLRELGWQPGVPMGEGVRRCVEWRRAERREEVAG